MSSTAASRSARCSATDLTSNQVWGLTKTDQEWSESLEAAPDGNPAATTSSTAPTPLTWQAASAESAESISASGWLRTA
jgi:hypothetical protein